MPEPINLNCLVLYIYIIFIFQQAEAFFKEKSVDEILRDSLPVNYDYHIVSVEPYQKQPNDLFDQSSMFTAEVRVNLKSKSEALQWLDDYKTSSYTDWNVRRTYPMDTKCIIFKVCLVSETGGSNFSQFGNKETHTYPLVLFFKNKITERIPLQS